MTEAGKAIDVVGVLNWLYQHYGPTGTLAIIACLPLLFFVWQTILYFRKDREANAALKAKEETIQHLAEELRLYRIEMFKTKFGWSDHQIEHWLLNNRH